VISGSDIITSEMTNRIVITMPPDVQEEIMRAAKLEGVSMAEFLRRAGKERAQKRRPLPKGLGMFESEETDLGRQAGDMKFEPPSWR
jgi:hypothetical protein